MNELRIELRLPKEKVAVCQRALALETENESIQRSKIEVKEFANGLIILVRANDLSAMRAAINTYLRWVIMCCKLIE